MYKRGPQAVDNEKLAHRVLLSPEALRALEQSAQEDQHAHIVSRNTRHVAVHVKADSRHRRRQ